MPVTGRRSWYCLNARYIHVWRGIVVSRSNSTAAIDDPDGLGHGLWQRVNDVPLVARPASPGSIRKNNYRFVDNLANEVFSRYIGGIQGARFLLNQHPLHLRIMRNVRSEWNAPVEMTIDEMTTDEMTTDEMTTEKALGISHQYLTTPSVTTISVTQKPSGYYLDKRPLRQFNDFDGISEATSSHEKSRNSALPGSTIPSTGLGEGVEPYRGTQYQYSDSNIGDTLVHDSTGRVAGAETTALKQPTDWWGRKNIGITPLNFLVRMSPTASISEIGDTVPENIPSQLFASGYFSSRPDGIVGSTRVLKNFAPITVENGTRSSRVALSSVSRSFPDLTSATGLFVGRNHLPAASAMGQSELHRKPAENVFVHNAARPNRSYRTMRPKKEMSLNARDKTITQHSLPSTKVIRRKTLVTGGEPPVAPGLPIPAIPFMVSSIPRIRRDPIVENVGWLRHRSVKNPVKSNNGANSFVDGDVSAGLGTVEVRPPMDSIFNRGWPKIPQLVSQSIGADYAGSASISPIFGSSASAGGVNGRVSNSSFALRQGSVAPAKTAMLVARSRAQGGLSSSPALSSVLQNQSKLVSLGLKQHIMPATSQNNLISRRTNFIQPVLGEKPSATRTVVLSTGSSDSTSQGGMEFLQRTENRKPTKTDMSSIQNVESVVTEISSQKGDSPAFFQSTPLGTPGITLNRESCNSGSAAANKSGLLQRFWSDPENKSELPLETKKNSVRMPIHFGSGVPELLAEASDSTSQDKMEFLQRTENKIPTITDTSFMRNVRSIITGVSSQNGDFSSYFRSIPLKIQGRSPTSVSHSSSPATGNTSRPLQRFWSGYKSESVLPLAPREIIARIPGHSELGDLNKPQLSSSDQLQAAPVNLQRSGEPVTNTRTTTTIEETEDVPPSEIDVEALVDKLWHKIQHKLTIERERNGMASRWG